MAASGAKYDDKAVEEIITKAVKATRQACAREAKDTFKATEKRLYAYPILQAKIKDSMEMIEEIEQHGIHGKSKSITRFIRSGTRLDEDEIKQAVLLDLRARLDEDTHEVQRIEKALEQIRDDEYKDIIRYRYFEEKNDEEVAKILKFTSRTVRTHKSRLVSRIAIYLYGTKALS